MSFLKTASKTQERKNNALEEDDEVPLYSELILVLLTGILVTLIFIAGDLRTIKNHVEPQKLSFIHKDTQK